MLFPPENANDDVTDCDSGDEEFTTMNNLPGSQLRNDVEIILEALLKTCTTLTMKHPYRNCILEHQRPLWKHRASLL
nr:unnamed protein product [Callosobruchus chinensis]